MGGMFFCKSTGGELLIALALGYIVCYLANREEKALKNIGLAIGIFIIAASVLLVAAKFAWKMQACKGGMGMPHKMMMQEQQPK